MREDPDNHRRLFDRGDDLKLAAALQAVFEVDTEHASEQGVPSPSPPTRQALLSCTAPSRLSRLLAIAARVMVRHRRSSSVR